MLAEMIQQHCVNGEERRGKTTHIKEQWQSDIRLRRVVAWGWYYMLLVLGHYSRFILAGDLKAQKGSGTSPRPTCTSGGEKRLLNGGRSKNRKP